MSIQISFTCLGRLFSRFTLDEFGTARRTAIVRAFIDALTRGGNTKALVLYCCPDYPNCLAHLNISGWVT